MHRYAECTNGITSVPNSSAAERYGDMEASVKLSSYYRKESLHLGSMQATSAAAGSEDPAPEVKDDCLETVKLTFHSIAGMCSPIKHLRSMTSADP